MWKLRTMKSTAHRKGAGCDGKVTAAETPATGATWRGKDSRAYRGEGAGVQHPTQAMTIGTDNCNFIGRLHLLFNSQGRTLIVSWTDLEVKYTLQLSVLMSYWTLCAD